MDGIVGSVWSSMDSSAALGLGKKAVKNAIDSTDKLSLIKATLSKLPTDSNGSNSNWIELVRLVCDEDSSEEFTTFKQLLANVTNINDKSLTGMALIHYIIAFNRSSYIELLHDYSSNQRLDLNLTDNILGYSPLMWAFALERTDCCTELLNYDSEIHFDQINREGNTAWSFIVPDSTLDTFLEQNNMYQYRTDKPTTGSTTIIDSATTEPHGMNDVGGLNTIDLKVAGLSLSTHDDYDHSLLFSPPSNVVVGNGDEENEGDSTKQSQIHSLLESFDFSKLVKYQYLEFADYDIPQLLDLLISLPNNFQHLTTYPAALLFQCVRYADHKLKAKQTVENLLHLALTKILASISMESDMVVTSVEAPYSNGDIIKQSYWLGALSFLYYYLCRDESFFKRHPSILQELVSSMHSIMIELTSSIHSRLNNLIEPTLLAYTTMQDVKQTLYKRDWNFFKKRKQAKLYRQQEKLLQMKKGKQHSLEHTHSNMSNDDDHQNTGDVADDGKSIGTNNDQILFYDTEILKHLYPCLLYTSRCV